MFETPNDHPRIEFRTLDDTAEAEAGLTEDAS